MQGVMVVMGVIVESRVLWCGHCGVVTPVYGSGRPMGVVGGPIDWCSLV